MDPSWDRKAPWNPRHLGRLGKINLYSSSEPSPAGSSDANVSWSKSLDQHSSKERGDGGRWKVTPKRGTSKSCGYDLDMLYLWYIYILYIYSPMVKTWDSCGIRSSAPNNHNGFLENEDVNPYELIDDQAPIWETNPCLDRDTYITLYNYI